MKRPTNGVHTGLAEPQDAQQEIFINGMDLVRKNHVYPMPDLSAQLRHDGRETTFSTKDLEPGIYLDAGRMPKVEELGAPDRFLFSPQDLLKLGRDDSQHNVFFGRVIASWFRGGETDVAQVAVKPQQSRYGSNSSRSLNELAMQQYMEQLGLPTLKALSASVILLNFLGYSLLIGLLVPIEWPHK